MQRTIFCLSLLVTVGYGSVNLRGRSITNQTYQRRLAEYYYSTSDPAILGSSNPDAAFGNPLKGLCTSPRWTGSNEAQNISSTLDFYYFGLDECWLARDTYDWTVLDESIAYAQQRSRHVVWRFFIHWPGQLLRLPQFLIDEGVQLNQTQLGDLSPYYDDPILLDALDQFIADFGARYDGHTTIAFIQLGLLGKWGEWHTYPDNGFLPYTAKIRVVNAYATAFSNTKLQTRYPMVEAYQAGIGLHDDSFAYSTLDGEANGGQIVSWFFWPRVLNLGHELFWKNAPMGGETRPELQPTIFNPGYEAGTPFKQDFNLCTATTHATYMLHSKAFANGGYQDAVTLENAKHAHALMGYHFEVKEISVAKSLQSGFVDIDIRIEQTGQAPFYYSLSLSLTCSEMSTPRIVGGVETLIDNGQSKVFSFLDIPDTANCLDAVEVFLVSPHTYEDRPIKFSQGDGTFVISLPTSVPPQETVFFVEAITNPDQQTFKIFSPTRISETTATISGTEQYKYDAELYKFHRWGRRGSFTYQLKMLDPLAIYTLHLGFAEIHHPNCFSGQRVMNIFSNGNELVSGLDVYDKVGCDSALVESFQVEANGNGELDIEFAGAIGNAFVSFIELTQSVQVTG